MKPLLIVIDLQNGWRHKLATEAVMLKAAKLAEKFPGDVIHCCFRNNPKSLFTTQLHWSRFYEASDTNQIPEIAKLDLPVYWRETYSIVGAKILKVIKEYKPVYVAGVFTDISVTASVMELFDLGIQVQVIEDCVATLHGEDVQAAALKSLSYAIGRNNLVKSEKLLI